MAAEVAFELLGGRGIDAGPTRSVRALHALGMARAEPCASFEYDIENAAAAFSSLSSLSIWHRERLREPTAGSLTTTDTPALVSPPNTATASTPDDVLPAPATTAGDAVDGASSSSSASEHIAPLQASPPADLATNGTVFLDKGIVKFRPLQK